MIHARLSGAQHLSTSFSRRSTLSSLESRFQWNQDCHWEDFIGIEFIGNKFHWNKFIGRKLRWDKIPLGAISLEAISVGAISVGLKPSSRHDVSSDPVAGNHRYNCLGSLLLWQLHLASLCGLRPINQRDCRLHHWLDDPSTRRHPCEFADCIILCRFRLNKSEITDFVQDPTQ